LSQNCSWSCELATYRRLMRVPCRIRSGISRAHGGCISQWRVGVSPPSPRAAPVDAIPANIRLLWGDVTANRRTTRTTFTLTPVSRISWSRPAGPLKQNNTHSASCHDSTVVQVKGKLSLCTSSGIDGGTAALTLNLGTGRCVVCFTLRPLYPGIH